MPNLTNIWTTLTAETFAFIISYKVVLPILFALSMLALVPKAPPLAKYFGRSVGVLLAVYLLLATPPATKILTAGLTRAVATDTVEKADAAVVLSRSDELGLDRYNLAIRLWQGGKVDKIFVTNFGRVWLTKALLEQQKIPLSVLNGTTCSKTTFEEAVSTAAILQPKRLRTIVLITDPLHILRATLTFQLLGFTVYPQMTPYPEKMSSQFRSLLALREYLGLLHYYILGRLHQSKLNASDVLNDQDLDYASCAIDWLDNLQRMI